MKPLRRPGSRPGAGRSHYQFKNWLRDESGQRQAPVPVRPVRGSAADLVSTCYYNPVKGTHTLYCLALDLDAHRAGPEWKTKKGKLKWRLIKKFLIDEHPELFKYIFAVVTSTGGKGLAVYFAISPLELTDLAKKARFSAMKLLEKLVVLFNQNGLGADPSAVGLKRDFCNWLDSERTVYENPLVLRSVQSDRTPVIRQLLGYLKPFGLCEYQKKSTRPGLLYPDLRAERKLLRLYQHLKNLWMDHETTVSMSVAGIRALTSLSRPFVEKFLKKPPAWLLTEYQGRAEGWALSIRLSQDLCRRCDELESHQTLTQNGQFSRPLLRPEMVEDGSRNHWITHGSLMLKHSGVSEFQACEYLAYHIRSIPGFDSSKNCKNFKEIIRNIYQRYQNLFAVNPGCAPAWLRLASSENESSETAWTQILSEADDPLATGTTGAVRTALKAPGTIPSRKGNDSDRSAGNTRSQMQIFLKKGGKPPAPVLRKVSADQCLIFQKKYYSLPKRYVGSKVLVFPWADKLRIYDRMTMRHIYTHKLLKRGRGTYQVDSEHVSDKAGHSNQYLEFLLRGFKSDGDQIDSFAKILADRYHTKAS